MNRIASIGVIGAGAWGTALAISAVRAGRQVRLWGRDRQVLETMRATRSNPRHLSGVDIGPGIQPCSDLKDLAVSEALLLAVPAQTIKDLSKRLPAGDQPLIVCAKGLERSSDRRLSQVIGDHLPGRPVAALSGPNFAREVALGLPAAATLGCSDEALGRALAAALSHDQFRLYWTDDLIGVEIGGAVKNVLAIAAGMVAGRGLGENAKAALITRGLAELTRLGRALGARRDTLMGLSGLGDLLLTAGCRTSRNMAFGCAIGAGADPIALRNTPGALVEGIATAGAVVRLARRCGRIDMPICQAVAAILDGGLRIDQALETLMKRPLKPETDHEKSR